MQSLFIFVWSRTKKGKWEIDFYFAFNLAAISIDLKIVTKMVHEYVHSGDNLTLPCVTVGGSYNPFLHPVIWYKVVPGQQKPVQINTGEKKRLSRVSIMEYTLMNMFKTSNYILT